MGLLLKTKGLHRVFLFLRVEYKTKGKTQLESKYKQINKREKGAQGSNFMNILYQSSKKINKREKGGRVQKIVWGQSCMSGL